LNFVMDCIAGGGGGNDGLTQSSVVTRVVKSGLHSMLECVRAQTFGRAGFQQVQLDLQWLRQTLTPLVDEPQVGAREGERERGRGRGERVPAGAAGPAVAAADAHPARGRAAGGCA
jgi:hypothetical protein